MLETKKLKREIGILNPPAKDLAIRLTSSRGKLNVKHSMVVGNTSQFIGDQSGDLPFKWMCYLRTTSAVPIEELAEKVQFHLDSSYKPRDIVKVDTPPFQIIRRGYGEFTLKVIVVFKDKFQMKPVQIYHRLRLDDKLSGHQSLGGETLSEFYTRDIFNREIQEIKAEESAIDRIFRDHDYFKIKQEDFDEKLTEECFDSDANQSSNDNIRSSIESWIRCHSIGDLKKNSNNSQHIDVESRENVEGLGRNIENHNNEIEIEQKFIEMSCREINLLPSSFDQSAINALVAVSKLFVKHLVEKSLEDYDEVSTKNVKNVIRTIPEFDFLR